MNDWTLVKPVLLNIKNDIENKVTKIAWLMRVLDCPGPYLSYQTIKQQSGVRKTMLRMETKIEVNLETLFEKIFSNSIDGSKTME